MSSATFEKIDDGAFAVTIPASHVVAFGDALMECQRLLQSALEDGLLPSLRMGHALLTTRRASAERWCAIALRRCASESWKRHDGGVTRPQRDSAAIPIGESPAMRPSVCVETTSPGFYFEGRPEPEMAARRHRTHDWWATTRTMSC